MSTQYVSFDNLRAFADEDEFAGLGDLVPAWDEEDGPVAEDFGEVWADEEGDEGDEGDEDGDGDGGDA